MNRRQKYSAFTMNVICIVALLSKIQNGNLRSILLDWGIIGYLCFRCFQLSSENVIESASKQRQGG